MEDQWNKVGIVITTHGNTGKFTIKNIDSVLKYLKGCKIILYNNESNDPLIRNIPNTYPDIKYFYIKNQKENNGLTGTWNQGIGECFKNNCDVIALLNNDLEINETFKYVIDEALKNKDNPYYYGVISNQAGHSSKYQKFRPINNYIVNNGQKPITEIEWCNLSNEKKNMYINQAFKFDYLIK